MERQIRDVVLIERFDGPLSMNSKLECSRTVISKIKMKMGNKMSNKVGDKMGNKVGRYSRYLVVKFYSNKKLPVKDQVKTFSHSNSLKCT